MPYKSSGVWPCIFSSQYLFSELFIMVINAFARLSECIWGRKTSLKYFKALGSSLSRFLMIWWLMKSRNWTLQSMTRTYHKDKKIQKSRSAKSLNSRLKTKMSSFSPFLFSSTLRENSFFHGLLVPGCKEAVESLSSSQTTPHSICLYVTF